MAEQLVQPAALTIAGSDSGGGAGLQADLRTLAKLGVHGASVVTCVTAQNPGAVSVIHPTPAKVVAAQLDSVFSSLPIRVVKIGMLYSCSVVDVVAKCLAKRLRLSLVVDPVMISSSGTPLLKPSAVAALANRLLPLAKLVTPNLDEAAALVNRPVREPEAMRDAVRVIHERFGCAVLVKGGHMKTTESIDLFYDGREEFLLSAPRIRGVSPPGTGCTYSAAITAFLARGERLPKAVELAKQHMVWAFSAVYGAGKHHFLG
ncbi:MAG: bifunctional hydroxymethylpyrimidine kinase/phosphomethylpyrimidine kinase [Verrucomicrobiota bacterium]|nr:bifunctional hydroxymethylpyrimidine kinase/phosphomethylpyrimidine kinase [Verrucomicrobiota bacterium]